jgi:hypothetical protein
MQSNIREFGLRVLVEHFHVAIAGQTIKQEEIILDAFTVITRLVA